MAETIPSASELVAEYLQTLAKLELPPAKTEVGPRVRKLVEQGCNERFLLEASYLYALMAHAVKRNAETERSTASSSRLIPLDTLKPD